MILATYEERRSALLGVQLLALSLQRHLRDARLVLFIPDARVAEFSDFLAWAAHQPNLEVRPRPFPTFWMSYNIKPSILKTLLQERDAAYWIDSDIVITRDFRHLLRDVTPDVFVAAEESSRLNGQGSVERTTAWGMDVGRAINVIVCTAFMRVTREHLDLLDAWQQLLDDPRYVNCQNDLNRPAHLLNDQDLLTALLGSTRFAHVPLKLLRRGSDIVQDIPGRGYAVEERLINLLHGHVPPMLHAQGDCKPWLGEDPAWRQQNEHPLLRANVELSPYFSEARKYRAQLGNVDCLQYRSPLARAMSFITFGNPTLQGLPLAAAYRVARKIKRLRQKQA